ncbi:D-alanyl-D-alanine carboxypeptidase [Kitasatospora sp. GP82]|uniref:D-alanyl-D-alanine carboxypeptidase family protein n=1 Tax=Kitasatospora sp. GP82 TaxID=3035089 RepID=UPI002474575F|nr:D-alanyl-D-alanine carboxypeptidase [Kitasatospora sp. GP82]
MSFCAATAAPRDDQPPPGMSALGGARLAQPGVQVAPGAGAPALPAGLTGRSWLVADAGTGDILAAQNAHWRLPPASTLKMLFADTVLPKLPRSTVHRVAAEELKNLGAGSSLVGIKEDLDYRVEDLWRGVFLRSGNDAVHVLAHMNGGIEQTVAQMQARAEVMGARDTHVVSPDGYDEDGQLSSAYDLTLFARAGLRNADFRSYCATKVAVFPGALDQATGRRTSFGIANTDRLLGRYPGLIGVKNGFTTKAGATFVGAAERGGRTLLVAVMHPESYMKVYDETAALLDWGFAAAGKVAPVGQLVEDSAGKDDAAAQTARAAQAGGPAKTAAVRRDEAGVGGWVAAGLCGLAGMAGMAALLRLLTRRRRARRLWPGTPSETGTEAVGATAVDPAEHAESRPGRA